MTTIGYMAPLATAIKQNGAKIGQIELSVHCEATKIIAADRVNSAINCLSTSSSPYF
ncbi:Uncharacterised protein [Vibrio cholerae]|nr:Uncharacterised protein [Vibrio cholerae]CSD06099.1 Uncharacterised protein [Vibrio cholerae]